MMDDVVFYDKTHPWTSLGIHRIPSQDEDTVADLICAKYHVLKATLQKPFWVTLLLICPVLRRSPTLWLLPYYRSEVLFLNSS